MSEPPATLPEEVIKVSAVNAVTGNTESAFVFSDDPDEINRVTNSLVFSNATPLAIASLSASDISNLAEKHSLLSLYSPSTSVTTSNLLIFLPGSGESSPDNNYLALGKKFDLPQTGVLSVLGTEELPFDLGYTWYHDMDYETGDNLDWGSAAKLESLKRSVRKMSTFLLELHDTVHLENVFLFGYDQGATVAMEVARENPLLGGVVAVCGGRPGAPGKVPVLQFVGGKDELYTKAEAKVCRERYGKELVQQFVGERRGHGMLSGVEETKAFHGFVAEKLKRRMPTLEKQCT